MGLTVKRIARLMTQPGRYSDGKCLYLEIVSSSNASWLFRYQRNGRDRMMGLGSLSLVTLEEARDAAHTLRKQLLNGIDPLDKKNEDKAARLKSITFEAAARDYHQQHKARYRNPKGARQWIASMESHVFPIVGSVAVSEIDVTLVLRVLEQPHETGVSLWHAIPKTASHIRGRIEAVLSWCQTRGYRSGDNPARWGGHLKNVLPSWRELRKPVHHPALPYAEVPAFMVALRKRQGISARALEFTVLTWVRTNETIGALWSEIDLENAIWAIPALRMKAERDHIVLLSPRAVEILKKLPREHGNPFVFVGAEPGKGLGNAAMSDLLERMGYSHVTVHGFRSAATDWAHECTAHTAQAIDLALAHRVSDETEAAYRRGPMVHKRRRLAEDWARYAGSTPRPATVVPIRGRQRSSAL